MSGMEPGKVLVPGTGPGVIGGLLRAPTGAEAHGSPPREARRGARFPAGRHWEVRPWKVAPGGRAASGGRQTNAGDDSRSDGARWQRSPYKGRLGAGGAGPAQAGRASYTAAPPLSHAERLRANFLQGQAGPCSDAPPRCPEAIWGHPPRPSPG